MQQEANATFALSYEQYHNSKSSGSIIDLVVTEYHTYHQNFEGAIYDWIQIVIGVNFSLRVIGVGLSEYA